MELGASKGAASAAAAVGGSASADGSKSLEEFLVDSLPDKPPVHRLRVSG